MDEIVPEDQEPATSNSVGFCKSCQSSWKPTRRGLIKASVVIGAAAVVAGVVGPFTTAANALTQADCDFFYEQATSACYAEYNSHNGEDDFIHRAVLIQCLGAAAAAKLSCEAALAAEQIAQALAAARPMIEQGIVVAGTVLLIEGVIVLFVLCVIATEGICAVAAAAAATQVPA